MSGGLFPVTKPTGHWLRDHSLSLVLAVIMVTQTAYCIYAGHFVYVREQPFGKGVASWGSEFWVWWTWEYTVSLVADTYGVILIVMLTKWLHEIGSNE